jgi:non-specific serine/threonine protein kinase
MDSIWLKLRETDMMRKNLDEPRYELIAVAVPDGFRVDREPAGDKDAWFDEELYRDFLARPFETLYDFSFRPQGNLSASVAFLRYIGERFIAETARDPDLEITRRARPPADDVLLELLHSVPFMVGLEYVNISWLRNIWQELGAVFHREIAGFSGSAADYLQNKNQAIQAVGRVFFHLVEHKSEDYPFAFLATYSTGDADNVSHLPLKNALLEHKSRQDQLLSLLSAVSKAADKSDFISSLVESGELFSPLRFTAEDAYAFLQETELYEECGIVCRIPDWWRKKGSARVSVSIGDKPPDGAGMEALLSFQPEIFLGGMEMSREEIEALLTQSDGLSFIKGKWVEVDREKLQAALAAFDKMADLEGMTFAEAMRLQLGLSQKLAAEDLTEVEITYGQWLNGVKNRLSIPPGQPQPSPGEDFGAVLRNYQQDGFQWLQFMRNLGFGALLADDMGLGKTVQVLALLEYLRQNGGAKTLLVIPASLLANWQKEAARFTPKLRCRIIHTQNRDFSPDEADLFITTYGMTIRIEKLRETPWDLVILDEAQAIKNPVNQQTKAVKQLETKARIAMTGTPVENRLSDLWSIFDFLNKGLLGTGKEFTAFTKALKDTPGGYARLRSAVGPFILRRLKTDPSIITDLPDKLEMKAFTTLSKKQVVLYKALVDDLARMLETADSDIARRGLVLTSVMKCKQICNHPDQYLGQTAFDHKHSGKFEKLAEICETVREKRERMLVFSQFKEMTEPLARYLAALFGQDGLILHGGTPVKKRGQMVERFNGREYVPFMVLSLKAGGVGLNLTAANHVVHFDRWWNPAIENQATDRVFRIGQQKNVVVHKFVTTGTIEEKIDAMLEKKQRMADDVIAASGENWITEMNDRELMKLFTLEVGL